MDKEKIERTCIVCGVIFNSSRSDARFCSGACKKKYQRSPDKYLGIGGAVGGSETVEPKIEVTKKISEEFFFKTPNYKTESGFWEDDDGNVVIRKAKYWYDVPIGAVPVIGDDMPDMPEFMNGREYFLWMENNFQVNESNMPVIINPLPKHDKVEYRMGGESSSMWSNR